MKNLFHNLALSKGKSFLLLAVCSLLLNLPGTQSLPLMDRDEPKFAQATWEMMETKQFTIPYFNTEYRFDKPPLTYWWMRAHYALLGKTEVAARLHSIFSSLLAGWVICLMGRFLYSPVAGLLAGLAWVTCFQVLIHSRLCVADMPMMLGIVITMYAVARLLFQEEEPRRFGRDFWLLVGGLTLGFLAKGPVAWIVPALALLLWCWPIGKTRFAWRRLQPVSSLLIAFGFVALWGLTANLKTDWAYWNVGIGDHVVKRGMSSFNGRVNVPLVYYLGTGILSLLPWSAFLPGALFVSKTQLREDRKRSFLTAWFLTPFLVFAFYATQLPHYILPGFPGLFLLLFSGANPVDLNTKLRKRWFYGVTGLMALFALLILLGGVTRIFPSPMEPVNSMILLAGGILALTGVFFPLAIRSVSANPGRWPLFGIIALTSITLTHFLSIEIRKHHPIMVLQEMGVFESEPGVKYVAQGFAEPSWVFYQWTGEPWLLTGNLEQGVNFMKEGEGKRAGIFLTEEWRIGDTAISARIKNQEIRYLQDQRTGVAAAFPPDQYEIREFSGLNIARTSWVKCWFVRPKAL